MLKTLFPYLVCGMIPLLIAGLKWSKLSRVYFYYALILNVMEYCIKYVPGQQREGTKTTFT